MVNHKYGEVNKGKPKKIDPKETRTRAPPRPGGRDPVVAVRLPPAIVAEVDLVAEKDGVGRSEAMRRLLEDALGALKAK